MDGFTAGVRKKFEVPAPEHVEREDKDVAPVTV